MFPEQIMEWFRIYLTSSGYVSTIIDEYCEIVQKYTLDKTTDAFILALKVRMLRKSQLFQEENKKSYELDQQGIELYLKFISDYLYVTAEDY